MGNSLQTQKLEVDDFSGGMTDNYIAGRQNQFQMADNLNLLKYGGDKAKLETRDGTTIIDSSYYRIPNNSRVGALFDLEGQLFEQSAKNVYFISSGWNTLTGPGSNPVLSAGTTSDYFTWVKWNRHVICGSDALSNVMKIFKDTTFKVRNLGLPELGNSPTITPGANTGKTFIYGFYYSHQYTSSGVTFEERGKVKLVTVTNADDPNVNANAITVIPVISNGATGNYATTDIKVKIYRTVNNGTTLYYVGEVTNGTTTYNDNSSDATVSANASIYTTGGVKDDEEPPKCKYLVQANDILWCLNVQEGGVTYPNRVRQSKKNKLYSCPSSFYEDLDDVIVGGDFINIYPIVFCENKVYRLEGYFDDSGRGGITKRLISDTVGCVSNRSIVRTKYGLFWAAADGFYWTDGFKVLKISEELPTTYKELVQTDTLKAKIYGTYDSDEERVLWSVQRDTDSNDNDFIFVAHVKFGIRPDTPFTTWSGGLNTDNFSPTAIYYYNKVLYYGNRQGYVLKFSSSADTDPKIDTSAIPSLWTEAVIYYDYRSCAYDFGTLKVRKWVPRLTAQFDNISQLTLDISSANDNSGTFESLDEVRYLDNFVWGDPTIEWGDPALRWNYFPVVDIWRHFPRQTLRCSYKQVRLANKYTVIDSSDSNGTGNLNGTANTIALNTYPSNVWYTDAVDYYMSFENDSYASEYKITARTDETLTLQDTNNLLPTNSGIKWQMKGYKKGDMMKLLSYCIDFTYLTSTQTAFDGVTGENA